MRRPSRVCAGARRFRSAAGSDVAGPPDEPATNCDLDHTILHAAGGPTHASNLKCYCRTHHLVKTFWGYQQLPDGTSDFDSPCPGISQATCRLSAQAVPRLCQHPGQCAAAPPAVPLQAASRHRKPTLLTTIATSAAMMPKRRRTCALGWPGLLHATERRQTTPPARPGAHPDCRDHRRPRPDTTGSQRRPTAV